MKTAVIGNTVDVCAAALLSLSTLEKLQQQVLLLIQMLLWLLLLSLLVLLHIFPWLPLCLATTTADAAVTVAAAHIASVKVFH